jgi:hypothetical protein
MLNEVVRKNKIAELLRLYKQVERKDFLVILKEMAAKKEIDSYVVKEVLDSLQTGVSENNEETGDIDNLAGQFYNLLKKVKNTEIKGDKGDDGEDGYTPQKGKDYFTNQEITEFKMSVTPIKGEDYFDGEDGYTPEKGKDYFTEKEIKEFKNAVTPIKGEDYFDGKDADEERVVEKVLKKIPKVDIKDIGGKEIVDKVNALEIKPELQIDAKHIKNLPSSQSPFMLPGGGGMSEVSHDTTLTGTGTSSDPLSVAISGLGLVDSVVAGTNIEVDNTDPANPVVSAPDVEPALGNPTVSGYILSSTDTGARSWIAPAAGGGDVDSVFGRNGDVVAAQDDYTFEQIDKTNANIADIPLRSHIDLQDIGVNAHTDIDNHLADSTIHFTPLTEGSVPFVAPGGAMTEANPGLVFDPSVNQLRIGVNALPILDGDAKAPLVIGGADAQWVQLYVQNTATSPYGMSLVSAINDISGAGISEVIGNMMGCGSSVIAHPAFPFLKPNDSFLCAFGGDQLIGAIYPTKKVLFFTGGGADDNIRLQIEEDKTSIIANKNAEIAPALEAANWTATNGYSAGSGVITLVNDIDDSTIQPNPALSITAGKTYEVTIVCSAHSGTVSYTLGGVTGSAIVEGTIDEYITANTTGNLIFTGTAGATCTITSIIVRELVADTGNLLVEGDIVLGSKLSTTTGAGILAANGEGVATFDSIPLLPASDPTNANHAVRKAYVDTFAQGLIPIANCRVATTTNGTLATAYENGDTIDGVTLATGDRILIKNQTTQSENGIYTVNASGAPTRATDYDEDSEVIRGTFTYITEGDDNASTQWVMYSDSPQVGTDQILFTFQPGITVNFVNLGTGEGVFYQQSELDIELKSILAGDNIQVSSSADEITIAGPTWTKETPSGLVNGSNTSYTLSNTPIANSLDLVLNTRVLTEGVDYILSGTTITMTTAISASYSSLPFIAKYQKL